jgi:hypothetical protein
MVPWESLGDLAVVHDSHMTIVRSLNFQAQQKCLRSKLKPRIRAGLFSYHFVHIYILRQRYRAAFLRP